MPNSDDEDGRTPEVDPAYLALYSEHLDDFRAHLAGKDGSETLPASYYPPNAYWTVAEKDAFFRALSVHSRLRPDLIAEEVKTKTVPDVCVYLALLENASRDASRRTVYVGKDNKTVDIRVPRKDFPIALEASEDWVQLEERLADALVASEPVSEKASLALKREEEISSRRKSIRARRGEGRTASNDRDREGEKQRRKDFETWLAEAQARWTAEDVWHSLDQVGMAALDRIIRGDEEGHAPADQEAGAENQPAVKLEGEGALLKMPDERTAPPGDGAAALGEGDEFIDPLLLELSRPGSAMSFTAPSEPDIPPATPSVNDPGPSTTQPVYALHPSSAHFQLPTPPFPPSEHPLTTEPAPTLLSSAVIVPPSTSAPMEEGSIAGDEPEEDVASMSPASRRRYQKRLYMRRKRAQAAGGVANENTGRLKPGRKPKQRPPKKSDLPRAESQAAPGSSPMVVDTPLPHEAEEATGGGERGAFRHPKMSGMTLPYKRQAQFASIGIDAQRLYQEGIGLFHLQSLSKLMQTYNQLHDVPPEVGSQISVDTIKTLHAIVVQFVAEVMSRAITFREQERIAKLQTKAWHIKENQNISAANVKHALALYGADSLDKRAHFASLLKKLGLEKDVEGEEDVVEEQDEYEVADALSPEVPLFSLPDGEAVDAEQEAPRANVQDEAPLQPLPLLRMLFPPFMNSPTLDLTEADEDGIVDPAVYMPWPSSSLLSTSAEPPREEDLLPEQIDEVALVAELLEDENIEKDDRLREVEAEKALWARFGGRSAHVTTAVPDGQDQEPPVMATADTQPEPSAAPVAAPAKQPRKRKRKGKPRGRSKSVTMGNQDGSVDDDGEGNEGSGVEEQEETSERRVRPRKAQNKSEGRDKGKGKGTAHLNEDQLRFMEPDPNGRIKSSVYVLDSD
ncbi:hypothetical protein BV20DRAFT_991941 [Pilatotrama ljubarskyi]|nr:hypothetical protein BV20DRAFT_991941 [Pilatotrama ljubarskyi]